MKTKNQREILSESPLKLPPSCKSVMENMEHELEKERAEENKKSETKN